MIPAMLGMLFVLVLGAAQAPVPDLTEIWSRRGCGERRPGDVKCPFEVADLPLTGRAIGLRDAFDEILAPKYDCVQATVPSLIIDPYNFKIEQMSDRLIFTYEKDDIVRTIWLNGAGPKPGVYDFFLHGHSVGRYEGSQLIVETGKFTFDPTGLDDMLNLPSSTQKRVTERYWREGNRLKVDVLTEDPLILREPIKFTFEWERTDSPLILPYDCDPELAKQPIQFLPSKYNDPVRQK
jgi:hypothetical protein